LIDALFKERVYYSVRDKVYNKEGSYLKDFVLDTEIMQDIGIPPKIIDVPVALRELTVIKKTFEEFHLPIFFMFGTCLGAIREKGFIKHDKDIDIGTYGENIDKIILAILKLRDECQFKVTKLAVDDTVISLLKDAVVIDIHLFHNCSSYWSSCNNFFQIPYHHLSELTEIDFLGIKMNVPNYVEDYLEYQYGSNWQIPVEGFYSYPNRAKRISNKIFAPILGSKVAGFISNIVSWFVKKLQNFRRKFR
jgi:hypothetical protein